MIIRIFTSPILYEGIMPAKKEGTEYWIGADEGAHYVLKKGFELDLAIGDFDSVSQETLDWIRTRMDNVVVHPEDKDKTDSDLAIEAALKHSPERVVVYGGIGRRIDHTYGNILFMKRGPVEFVTDHQWMKIVTPGTHRITHDYAYISFFAIEHVRNLHLDDFRFPLKGYDLSVDDPLCISNEGSGTVSFDEGLLLVIAAND